MLGQVKASFNKSRQVGTGQVKTGQDRSSKFFIKSNLVRTSKVKLGQLKSSYDKLGKIKSDRQSQKFFSPKIFDPKFL